MSFKRFHLLILVVAMAALVAACGGGNNDNASDATASTDAVEIKVTLNDFNIIPETIELTKGQPVKLVVTNEAPVEAHDLVITGLGVNVKTKSLKPGETETITFTPNQSGTIESYCSIPGHKALGMVGEVQVQ